MAFSARDLDEIRGEMWSFTHVLITCYVMYIFCFMAYINRGPRHGSDPLYKKDPSPYAYTNWPAL